MGITVFGGEKGGTGKTTLATNIAAMLALRGKDVLLIDTDKQGTASFWATVREEDGVEPRIPSVQKFGKGLGAQIEDLAERYDEVIVDAGGRDSLELRYALGVADRVYIPVQPFQFDIWTMRQMDQLVEMAQSFNPKLEAYIILNRVSTNPVVREDKETREFLLAEELENLDLLNTVIRDRIAFRKAARDGLSVQEVRYDRKAVTEMYFLYEEIYDNAEKEKSAA